MAVPFYIVISTTYGEDELVAIRTHGNGRLYFLLAYVSARIFFTRTAFLHLVVPLNSPIRSAPLLTRTWWMELVEISIPLPYRPPCCLPTPSMWQSAKGEDWRMQHALPLSALLWHRVSAIAVLS